jgi:hypothetical protein
MVFFSYFFYCLTSNKPRKSKASNKEEMFKRSKFSTKHNTRDKLIVWGNGETPPKAGLKSECVHGKACQHGKDCQFAHGDDVIYRECALTVLVATGSTPWMECKHNPCKTVLCRYLKPGDAEIIEEITKELRENQPIKQADAKRKPFSGTKRLGKQQKPGNAQRPAKAHTNQVSGAWETSPDIPDESKQDGLVDVSPANACFDEMFEQLTNKHAEIALLREKLAKQAETIGEQAGTIAEQAETLAGKERVSRELYDTLLLANDEIVTRQSEREVHDQLQAALCENEHMYVCIAELEAQCAKLKSRNVELEARFTVEEKTDQSLDKQLANAIANRTVINCTIVSLKEKVKIARAAERAELLARLAKLEAEDDVETVVL